jgi:hypothetical protein
MAGGRWKQGQQKRTTDHPKVVVLAFAVRLHVATGVHQRRRSLREKRASVRQYRKCAVLVRSPCLQGKQVNGLAIGSVQR